jgi:chromodomain-helicase-DNA-binding protein 3/chromodomain-helicase-DNA-binding protein 4
MKSLNGLSTSEQNDIVVYGFSVLHRLDFLEYILTFGVELDSLDAFFKALSENKPESFRSDMRP